MYVKLTETRKKIKLLFVLTNILIPIRFGSRHKRAHLGAFLVHRFHIHHISLERIYLVKLLATNTAYIISSYVLLGSAILV